MTRELFYQAILKFVLGTAIIGILIFLPAGTFDYWNAWLFMGILFIPMFFAGIVMMIKNPELLKKRLNAKEQQAEQNLVIKLRACLKSHSRHLHAPLCVIFAPNSGYIARYAPFIWHKSPTNCDAHLAESIFQTRSSGLMFILGFVIAGLNFRFKWIILSDWVSWVGAVIFLFSYLLYAEVLRENTYLSRTVEVQNGQKVIDTGLYGIVRHPMYSVTIILFLSMPLVLGSIISFVVFLTYPVIIAKRIKNEEIVLEKDLDGYIEYKKNVKYKLIPFLW